MLFSQNQYTPKNNCRVSISLGLQIGCMFTGLEITKEICWSRGQVAQQCTCPYVFVLVRIYWTTSWFYRICPGDMCLLNLLVPHHFYLSRTIGQSVFSNPVFSGLSLCQRSHTWTWLCWVQQKEDVLNTRPKAFMITSPRSLSVSVICC